MSAYVVSHETIDALVGLALVGPSDRGAKYAGDGWYGPHWRGEKVYREHADELGADLLHQNRVSVAYRYDEPIDGELPGKIGEGEYTRHTVGRKLTAVEGLKVLDCYDYQSCEDPGWETSDAHGFSESLRSCLISALPGYDVAPWGID